MVSLPSMAKIVAWLGLGNGLDVIAAVSAVLTIIVLLTPVVAGLILFGLERLQVKLIGSLDRDFAYFFVNFVTFPGTFVHEIAHMIFAVVTGAEVNEICMFENDGERLGHISYHTRGPWFMVAVQHSLIAVAPTVVGSALGYVLLEYIFAGVHSVWEYIGLWYLVISLIDHSTMSDSDLEHYFQGVWIFILPVFLVFFGLGYWG